MKSVKLLYPEGSPNYYEKALKYIEQQFMNPLSTPKGKQTLMSIAEKIAYAHMDLEIESILSDVEEMDAERESTKVESMNTSKKNSSKGHILIRAALQSSQEPLSRTELANATNLRVSAVCARVKELLDEGSLRVAGTKWDTESERNVETLELV